MDEAVGLLPDFFNWIKAGSGYKRESTPPEGMRIPGMGGTMQEAYEGGRTAAGRGRTASALQQPPTVQQGTTGQQALPNIESPSVLQQWGPPALSIATTSAKIGQRVTDQSGVSSGLPDNAWNQYVTNPNWTPTYQDYGGRQALVWEEGMGIEGQEPGALSEGLGYAAQGLGTLATIYNVGSALYQGDYAGAARSVAPQAIQAGANYAAANAATVGAEAAAAGAAVSSYIPVVNIVAAVETGRQMYGNTGETWENRSTNEKYMAAPGAQAGTGHLGDFALRNAPDSPIAKAYDWMAKMEDKTVGRSLDAAFGLASTLLGGPSRHGRYEGVGEMYSRIPTLSQAQQIAGGQNPDSLGVFGTESLMSPDYIYLKEHPEKIPEEVWSYNNAQYSQWFKQQLQSDPELVKWYNNTRKITDPAWESGLAAYNESQGGGFMVNNSYGFYDDIVGAPYKPPPALGATSNADWWTQLP